MIQLTTTWRRSLRGLAWAGALVSGAMLVISIGLVAGPNGRVSAAANAGALQILVPAGTPTAGQPITNGVNATVFALTPPTGASCTGDTTTGGYKVQSYIVPASVDPATLTYDSLGPISAATGSNFRQPLYSAGGTPVVNKNTAIATVDGGGGLLTGLPTISFGVFTSVGPDVLPSGTYNIGFACTMGPASATQLDRYWNVQITITAASPTGMSWVAAAPPTESTTTTTTLAGATTTTTTLAGATTTTVAGATTTVQSGSSTPTSVSGGVTTTLSVNTTLFGASASSGGGYTGGSIVATGSSPIPIAMWAILLLVFGRMALLLGRPLRVVPPRSQ